MKRVVATGVTGHGGLGLTELLLVVTASISEEATAA